uniref:Uncharacterized protein n=1 Tax=Romanomermis culicivorax TaxID=13658 RepID=A0A915HGB8_ROMCU
MYCVLHEMMIQRSSIAGKLNCAHCTNKPKNLHIVLCIYYWVVPWPLQLHDVFTIALPLTSCSILNSGKKLKCLCGNSNERNVQPTANRLSENC